QLQRYKAAVFIGRGGTQQVGVDVSDFDVRAGHSGAVCIKDGPLNGAGCDLGLAERESCEQETGGQRNTNTPDRVGQVAKQGVTHDFLLWLSESDDSESCSNRGDRRGGPNLS